MFVDVLIIGAGPCGLAVAARLAESTPSALFTDDEHARYWKRFNRRDTLQAEAARRRKRDSVSRSSDSGYESESSDHGAVKRPSMVVLDASSGSWLANWKARFAQLAITHLRSPLFFHPDPRDRDGLLAYAYEQGRESELVEIHNVAGKEYSKHARKKQRSRRPNIERHLRVDGRDRIDYYTPSVALFEDYCRSVVERYGLEDVVQQAVVQNVTYDDVGWSGGGRIFKVDTDQGLYLARVVVLATGPTAKPCIPADHGLRLPSPPSSSAAVSHVFFPGALSLPPQVAARVAAGQRTHVVVVGGGLTSAQVAAVLLARGVSHVYLLIRSKYKLKHFDVDLEWVSKVRNQRMSEFWSAETDQERAGMLMEAKNGGSITPAFDRVLQTLVRQGKLTICAGTKVTSGEYRQGSWAIQTEPAMPNLPDIDHVYFATGVRPDFNGIPFLDELRRECPLDTISGLPVITDDLMYDEDTPFFFTGALAALRLGPGAANLAGARQGAERVAWKVEEMLKLNAGGPRAAQEKGTAVDEAEEPRRGWSAFAGGWANQFESLAEAEGGTQS